MEIKVVPFVPNVTDVNPASSAASELQSTINTQQNQGWTFVSMESMQTVVKPTGCNSLQGKGQGQTTFIQLLIFKKV